MEIALSWSITCQRTRVWQRLAWT